MDLNLLLLSDDLLKPCSSRRFFRNDGAAEAGKDRDLVGPNPPGNFDDLDLVKTDKWPDDRGLHSLVHDEEVLEGLGGHLSQILPGEDPVRPLLPGDPFRDPVHHPSAEEVPAAVPGEGDVAGPVGDHIGPDRAACQLLEALNELHGLLRILLIREGAVVHVDRDDLHALADHQVRSNRGIDPARDEGDELHGDPTSSSFRRPDCGEFASAKSTGSDPGPFHPSLGGPVPAPRLYRSGVHNCECLIKLFRFVRYQACDDGALLPCRYAKFLVMGLHNCEYFTIMTIDTRFHEVRDMRRVRESRQDWSAFNHLIPDQLAFPPLGSCG